MLVSIILSFRNEAEIIPEMIGRMREAFKKLEEKYELIFINDDSTDDSLALLTAEAKKDKAIKIINMSRVFGVSQCVLAGMSYAHGDAVIYMDADLQDPPELIPELVKKWHEGADVVYTTRLSRSGESAIKMWITKAAYGVIKYVSDVEMPSNSGDFKLLSRRAVDELLKLEEKDPYLRGLVSWIGFKQVQVFYHREKRYAGETHFPLLKSINPVKTFIAGVVSFSTVPLYVSLIIGFLVSLAAFLYLIAVIIMKMIGMNIPGWTALMCTILILGGMQLFTTGIVGLYIGRIYNESKKRPNYIIDSTVGFDSKK